MTKRFLHVAFARPVPRREMDQVFDRVAEDWLRYSSNCWVLWTDRTADGVLRAVRRRLGPDDQVLIAALDIDRDLQGLMDKSVWDWFYKSRD
jgi:hypothetical protein